MSNSPAAQNPSPADPLSAKPAHRHPHRPHETASHIPYRDVVNPPAAQMQSICSRPPHPGQLSVTRGPLGGLSGGDGGGEALPSPRACAPPACRRLRLPHAAAPHPAAAASPISTPLPHPPPRQRAAPPASATPAAAGPPAARPAAAMMPTATSTAAAPRAARARAAPVLLGLVAVGVGVGGFGAGGALPGAAPSGGDVGGDGVHSSRAPGIGSCRSGPSSVQGTPSHRVGYSRHCPSAPSSPSW